MVRWLGLRRSAAGGTVSISSWGVKILRAKKKKEAKVETKISRTLYHLKVVGNVTASK